MIQLRNRNNGTLLEVKRNKFVLSNNDGLHIIQKETVVYVKADGNYCAVICKGGRKITCAQTLKAVASKINMPSFYRIHQSFYINFSCVTCIAGDFSMITIDGDIHLPVSRSRRSGFRTFVATFIACA